MIWGSKLIWLVFVKMSQVYVGHARIEVSIHEVFGSQVIGCVI